MELVPSFLKMSFKDNSKHSVINEVVNYPRKGE